MSAAWAADAAGHASEHFYEAAEFWVAIAFVIVVVLAGRAVWRIIATALDNRAAAIQKRVDEADALLSEAEDLLASYHRRQREAVSETAAIVERARADAQRAAEKASADLERSVQRREQLARDRIAQAEAAAVAEVRAAAVDVAMEATRRVLVETTKGEKADALVDKAIAGLSAKIH